MDPAYNRLRNLYLSCGSLYISDLSCTNYLNSTLQVSCQEAAGEALETLGAVRVPAERVWCCKSTMLRQAGMLPLNGTERVAIYQFNGTVRVAVFKTKPYGIVAVSNQVCPCKSCCFYPSMAL